MSSQFEVRTPAHACFVDITMQVDKLVSRSGVEMGICHIFIPHTTAGVTINENADPTVRSDILSALEKMVPWRANYDHAEGNAAAHVKASMMGSSQVVFISHGKLNLGTWQGIYLTEFDGPRTREVWIKIVAC